MFTKNRVHNAPTLRFYGDEFVFNTTSGMCYHISATAGFLLRKLIDGAGEEQLVILIQQQYGIDQSTAIRDVELLLNNLTELGIID